MTDLEYWEQDGIANGWTMPAAAWWKRLPVIRRFRAIAANWKVQRHNRFWRSLGRIPTGYDSWVVYGIAMGKERPE